MLCVLPSPPARDPRLTSRCAVAAVAIDTIQTTDALAAVDVTNSRRDAVHPAA